MRARILSMLLAGVLMFSAFGTTVSAQEIQSIPEELTAEAAVQEAEFEAVPEEAVQDVVIEAVPEDEVTGAEITITGGSDKASAKAIELEQSYIGTLEKEADKENAWYKFTTHSAPGYYYFHVKNIESGTPYAVYLLTENGDKLKETWFSSEFTNAYKLDPGATYYIRVHNDWNCEGKYKFDVSYTADPEGNSIEEAYGLTADTPYRGTNAADGEYDYYKFTTGSAGYYEVKIINESMGSYADWRVHTVYGEKLSSGSVSRGSTKNSYYILEANTTYGIYVKGNGSTGYYTVQYRYLPDNEGNTQEAAYSLKMDQVYRGTNAIDGDEDYYKFTTGKEGYYQVKLVNESVGSRVQFVLKSQWGENLSSTMYAYKDDAEYITMILDANTTYYLYAKGTGTSGNYTVVYTYLPDSEGDTLDSAAGLSEGKEYRTTLCVDKDVDYYKIVPNFSGRYHINLVNTDGESSMNYGIYSEYGELLDDLYYVYKGNDKTIKWTLTKGTTYYLKVAGGSYAEYVISFEKDFPFTDVSPLQEGHWQYEAVEYVYENNIMSGKKDTLFDPGANLTRAEFAQVLYNMAGKPYVSYQSVFTDVPRNQWYTSAVIWAYKQGIVSGYSDGRFGIKDNITREQVAKMLYMYSEYKRENVSYRASLSSFPDNGQVSGWAKSYVEWAVAMKMISGKNVNGQLNLVPKGQATRAECAAMISRYLQN